MHIVVLHRITDPDEFFSHDAEEISENAPPGAHARQFFPSEDRTSAVCLWEADSIEPVQGYLDQVTDGIAENTYFEVNSEFAMGLPQAAGAGA